MGAIPRLASLRGHLAQPVVAFSSSVERLQLTLDGGLAMDDKVIFVRPCNGPY